jgi:hypothetical protein
VAVPRAVLGLARGLRGPGRFRAVTRALLALPVAVVSSGLTGLLAFLVLINVLAYPLRPYLGVSSHPGDVWSNTYADSWGGPTLAGAWLFHAAGVLLLLVPALTLAVHALMTVQRRLLEPRPAPASTALPVPAPVQPPAPVVRGRPDRAGQRSRGGLRKTVVIGGAVTLSVAFSLTAHSLGIGDNLLWLPRDLTSTAALAIALAPLVFVGRRMISWSYTDRGR